MKFKFIWVVGGLALVAVGGCGRPSPTASAEASEMRSQQTQVAGAGESDAPEPTTDRQGLSPDQVDRLFETSWVADDKATLAYPDNQSVDDLDGMSWQYCIEWKARGFFKDSGFKMKTTRDEYLIPIDYGSGSPDVIRVIDDNQFALRNGALWIVFKAASG